jgi:hypothetical protein
MRGGIAAAGAVALVLAAGCGSEETTTWSDDGVSVAYPKSWKPRDIEVATFALQGPHMRAGVLRSRRLHATAAELEGDLRAGRLVPIWGARHIEPTDVPGAEAAFRITVEKRSQRLVEVMALTEDEEISVSVVGSPNAVESEEVEAMLDSFRVG